MLQRRGNLLLNGATIKGINMLPIGSIFLSVAPMRRENNIKGHIEKLSKLNYANMSVFFKSPNFDAAIIKCFTVIRYHSSVGRVPD